MTTLALLLIPLAAEQPNATFPIFPIFTKQSSWLQYFYDVIYLGGMQHAIAIAVTKLAHSNI